MTHPPRVRQIMVTFPKRLGADARIADVRAEFEDEHVHMVLVVDRDGRLVTAIERLDLTPELDASSLASVCGRLEGRTVSPMTPLPAITRLLGSTGRRRLAVVDDDGLLRGLVCLKRSRSGYCDDKDVRARANERGETLPARLPRALA